MALGSLSAGAAAAIAAAASAAGGLAKSTIGALTGGKERDHEKDLETIHTTEPGFNDFGDELVDQGFGIRQNPTTRPKIFNLNQNEQRKKVVNI